MSLLQISEPGQSPDPHQRRVAVGIDLGTTHSLVAAVRHGVPECLPDDQGRVILPSVVRYLEGGARQIGFDAQAHQAIDAAQTIVSVKRLMGRRLSDVVDGAGVSGVLGVSGVGHWPYEWLDRPGMVAIQTCQGAKTPVEVSAEILATLRQRAEDTFGSDIFGAVITVPAYFDDAQRQATKDAAQLAGLNVLRLINEPTAAAVAYGLENGSEGLYAVYDLGGGTFDMSLLRLTRGVFEVVATGGDAMLGGDDFDAALAQWVLNQVARTVESANDRREIQVAARRAKEALSDQERVELVAQLSSGELRFAVDRTAFEQACAVLVARTMTVVRRVLRDAKVSSDEVQGVVLVGGSTRMPAVRHAVKVAFGKEPLTDVNPDEVVALGAAIQANALAGNATDGELLLLDVVPLSLGLETMGGVVERIVERNSTIPVAKAQDFTTYQDGQTALAVHVVQGERDLVADCRSLARFELRGIPPMVAGAARIRVTFQVDADGLLSVQAKEMTSGVEASVIVKPSYGLGDDEVARMLQEGFAHADADMRSRQLSEARVEAQRMILATHSALSADADLLSEQERADIEALIHRVQTVAQGDNPQAMDDAVQALAQGTEGFAAARMNRGIRVALAGRRIEEI